MAGVITHLVIANEMLKNLPEGIIENVGLFYLGSFAPDAIHARQDYIRAYKKHTHFRDDIPDGDFELPDNYEQYKTRLVDFIIKNKDRQDGLIDLYRGYVVHILTDELFIITLRKEFCLLMKELGIGQYEKPFFERIVTDMHRNDFLLIDRYEDMDKIKTKLEQVPIYPIENYIQEEEMRITKEWLLEQHFYVQRERLEPEYLKYQKMTEFIYMAAKEIIKRLAEGVILPRML